MNKWPRLVALLSQTNPSGLVSLQNSTVRGRQVRKRLPPATQTHHLWRGGGAVNSSKGPQAHATPR